MLELLPMPEERETEELLEVLLELLELLLAELFCLLAEELRYEAPAGAELLFPELRYEVLRAADELRDGSGDETVPYEDDLELEETPWLEEPP